MAGLGSSGVFERSNTVNLTPSKRTKPLNVVEPVAVDDMTAPQAYQLPAPKGACKMIPASEAATLIRLLQTEAKVL